MCHDAYIPYATMDHVDNVDIQVSPDFHFDLNVYGTFDVYIALDFNIAPHIKAEPM